jgi:hypothetical protein
MARHEARVEHAPDMRSPGLSKPDAPQGNGGTYSMHQADSDTDGAIVVTSKNYYSTVSAHSAGAPSPSPSIRPSNYRPKETRGRDAGRGTNGTVDGLDLY